MYQQPLKPRGKRAARILGTGVVIRLVGLGTESTGASTAIALIVIGIGGLVVIGGGIYWIAMMVVGRGG